MDLSGLNAFSAAASRLLFERYPELRPFSRVEHEGGQTYLAVAVPAPSEAQTQHGLLILTKDDEVTVGFDYYHSHFSYMAGEGDDRALPFIDDLLADKIAAVSWWHGLKWRRSGQVRADEQLPIDWLLDYDRVHVRSWRGTLNRDYAPPVARCRVTVQPHHVGNAIGKLSELRGMLAAQGFEGRDVPMVWITAEVPIPNMVRLTEWLRDLGDERASLTVLDDEENR